MGFPPSPTEANTKYVQEEQDELALDGIRYALLEHSGQSWRMASLDPLWRQGLMTLGPSPDADALDALNASGTYLAPTSAGDPPPLAVICCGLGSVWPGMGRELYDNFPAARAAMDHLASLADWDLLSLMDETDVEKIGQTRWQIPYLFLLEYAQWSQFLSLGLTPSLMCGHSLGELIALCFAGIYAPEVAWYILDTRAIHMAELEARASRDTGMMAVHAGADVIAKAQQTWPSLYVSNYNTPKQHILSGPREILLEARKSLRKERVPAMMLNVSLAFHHPSMRILRDMSLRRLNALAMQAPRLPMLSGITADLYPQDQPSICRYITDLDENSVRWVECVQIMQQRYSISQCLELGPQDTLCGLVQDIAPELSCCSAARKGHETEAMRLACARLYSLGHLPISRIKQSLAERREEKPCSTAQHHTSSPRSENTATASTLDPLLLQTVLGIVARASGSSVEDLRPDMDLRYDLALRSSRFPLLLQEAESALDIKVDFERLLQVSTIMDLAMALAGMKDRSQSDADMTTGADVPAQMMLPPISASQDLGRMLEHEVFSGQEYLLFRRRIFEDRDIPDSTGFSLAFADREPSLPAADNLLQACCHFSHYADPALSCHGLPSCLPVSRILLALMEGASMLVPHFMVNGLSDVRLASPLPLPSGITRECRLRAQARLWLEQDGVRSRMCYTWLSSRTLMANGRRTAFHEPLAEGMVLLADQPAALTPIWHHVPTGPGLSLPCKSIQRFYDGSGLGDIWRFLADWMSLKQDSYLATLADRPYPLPSIAPAALWRYTEAFHMVEAIVQAAQLALQQEAPLAPCPWQLGTVGFVRFGDTSVPAAHIILRRSWADENLRRFEAQACDTYGQPILTIHRLEFERYDQAAPQHS